MAETGAVNRPEAKLRPVPRRKAPWAVGCEGQRVSGWLQGLDPHPAHLTRRGRRWQQPLNQAVLNLMEQDRADPCPPPSVFQGTEPRPQGMGRDP